VGLVAPKQLRLDEPPALACGRTLAPLEIVYETYGELNAEGSNAVLICHALSGDHHAAGYHSVEDRRPGWWDACIGPGKPIDTRRFFVVCPNNPGGCAGSTGPASIDPTSGRPWGPDFPPLQVADWVACQARLAEHLGIRCWAAVIGGSLGGMQAMHWAVERPQQVAHCVVIASAIKLSAQNIAFNEIARQAIQSDPDYAAGRYLERDSVPRRGLSIARMIGHVTYLSDELMGVKFGRALRHDDDGSVRFQVESYLRYQGERFSGRFDANTYLLMTRVLDDFDLARDYDDDPVAAFRRASAAFLVLSFSSDWRFAPARSREIVDALVGAQRRVCYAEIEANHGHDAFLMPIERYLSVFAAYMERVWHEVAGDSA
jgi:homoserine O-acetyltransferase